ncbi:MAG: autotransporter-associated beta strand repeat-containing protein [Rariglobus sp.]
MKSYPALLTALICIASPAAHHAAPLTYDGSANAGLQDGGGLGWNTTNTNWWDSSANAVWSNSDTSEAIFGVTSTQPDATVNVSTVTTNKITFTSLSSGNYQLLGGTITLAGTGPAIVNNNTANNGAIIRSKLVGTSGFTKSGTGTLTLGAGSDLSEMSGTISLSGGNVFLSATTAGSAAAAWNISASNTALGLGVNGTVDLGSLSGVAGSILRTAGTNSPTASIGALNTSTTFSGNVTGTMAITKVGTGTLTLAATSNRNTYTGGTTVSAGTLALGAGGSINNTTSITVASGATFDVSAVTGYTLGASVAQTLKGSGTVNGSVNLNAVNATLIVGDAGTVGVLTFNNNLALAGTTSMDLLGVTNGTYDKVSVGGTLTNGGALQLVIDANFASSLATAGGSATLSLFNVSSAGNFTSISMSGLDTGLFATTTAGSSFVGVNSGITYTWVGDGTLAVSAIPEPSSIAALAGVLSLVVVVTGRRRR